MYIVYHNNLNFKTSAYCYFRYFCGFYKLINDHLDFPPQHIHAKNPKEIKVRRSEGWKKIERLA